MSKNKKLKNTLEEIRYSLRSKYTIPTLSGIVALFTLVNAIQNSFLYRWEEYVLLIALIIFALSMIYVDRANKKEYDKICKTKVFAMEVIRTYESLDAFNSSLEKTLPYYADLLIYSSTPKTIRFGYGATILSEIQNIINFIYETEIPTMSNESKQLYKKAIYFTLLLMLIDDYHFSDEDEPIGKANFDFFILLLNELDMNDCRAFAETFCSKNQREELLKKVSKKIQFYFD